MIKWNTCKNILDDNDIKSFIKDYREVSPEITGFDTETTGLNIIKDKPFLIVFGFINKARTEGWTYLIDKRDVTDVTWNTFIRVTELLSKKAKEVVAYNAKYDLHMMYNIGFKEIYHSNITDAQIYIRLAHPALTKTEGGPPPKLKDYATQYIDKNAKLYNNELNTYKKYLTANRTRALKQRLSHLIVPDHVKVTGNEKGWTMKILQNIMSDKVLGFSVLDKEHRDIIDQVYREFPNPDLYLNYPKDMLHKYADRDVVLTLEAFILNEPIAIKKGQDKTIKLEKDLIIPLMRSERVGFKFNLKYAEDVEVILRRYILKRRGDLYELAGTKMTIGQSELIQEISKHRYGEILPSTGKEVLANYQTKNPKFKSFIDTILELRTLEKWYSAYLIRLMNGISDGRVYTSINQTGTVSGRVSSDFQQFPSNPIRDSSGEILFHPRRLIQVTGGDYPSIYYFDYSQIELRFQAIYTILVSGGDTNLCRAYMPFRCVDSEGNLFEYNNPDAQKTFRQKEWFLEEDRNTKWHDLDLHTHTTLIAFPDAVNDGSKKWSNLRKMGKQTNFASNYGASIPGLKSSMNISDELAKILINAYYKAFPELRNYRQYVKRIIAQQGYISNLFDRKYFGASAHKCGNYIVQGSAADYLKKKMVEIDKYLTTNGYKTRFQMNIHDEMSFEYHKDDPIDVIKGIKRIMEDLPGSPVPIVADVEMTTTTWDEKGDVEL